MKTLIAVPCMDMLPVDFVKCLLYMKKGDETAVYMKPNSLVYDSRNLLSLYAIENGFDQVMWLDSDMMFPPDILQRLESWHEDMVTGLYVKRHSPVEPVIYQELKEPERDDTGRLIGQIKPYPYGSAIQNGETFTVAGCGMGCCLTSVKLLKEVWDTFGPAFTPFPWAGEDISFCYRVGRLGYKIWCDASVSCGHIGTFMYTTALLGGDKD